MADPDTPEAPLVLALSSASTSSSTSHAKYTCVCKQGFYIPNETVQGFQSDKVESDGANFSCVPCPSGCLCDKDGSCMFGDEPEDFITESFLRATIGAIIGACIGCCLILMLVVFRQRKCKVSIENKNALSYIDWKILYSLFFLFSLPILNSIAVYCSLIKFLSNYRQ